MRPTTTTVHWRASPEVLGPRRGTAVGRPKQDALLIVFAVGASSGGEYAVTFRYANAAAVAKDLTVYVNGIQDGHAVLASTAGSNRWSTASERLPLRSGVNTIALVYELDSAQPVSLDRVAVSGGSALLARGATVPYQEYEAESAATNGRIIGPDRVWGHLATEASGRKAVTLDKVGQYVEFSLVQAANGMEVRYSLPDAGKGGGIAASLGLYVDGKAQKPLALSSKYSYIYGPGAYSENPEMGDGYHVFDEIHVLFPTVLPSGSKVRLQIDRGDSAPTYTIDLADFEQVPAPYAMPPGYLSAAAFGVDPAGSQDSTSALQRAVNVAKSRHQGLHIPEGMYTITGHIILDEVTVRGAGPWYTVLHGEGVGLYGDYPANPHQWYKSVNGDGRRAPSARVGIYDLMILGETTDRVDSQQVNGVGGAFAGGSAIQNVWIEHTKVGMWLDGPFSDLLVVGCRLRDLTADGLNLHDGVANVTVEQTQVRNTGDDGLALWSDQDADSFDVFRNNTVQIPTVASNIAMYCGQQNSIIGNYVSDTVTQGGGISIANRSFQSGGVLPLTGTILVTNNMLVRTGQVDLVYGVIGALWFKADFTIDAQIIVAGDEIDESAQEAIQFQGNGQVENVTFDDIVIHNTPTFVFQVEADVYDVTISHVVATNTGVAGVYNCGNIFAVKDGQGNSGWSKAMCVPLLNLVKTTLQGSKA